MFHNTGLSIPFWHSQWTAQRGETHGNTMAFTRVGPATLRLNRSKAFSALQTFEELAGLECRA